MIKSISIENFRGIPRLELENVNRITLLSGKNNIGKSSVLEAVFLHMDHTAIDSFGKLNYFRGSSVPANCGSLWEPLFYQLDTRKPMSIHLQDDDVVSILEYQEDRNYLPNSVQGVPDDAIKMFRAAARSGYTLRFHFERDKYYEDGHFILNGDGALLRDIETSLPKDEMLALTPTRFINSFISRTSDNVINGIGQVELEGRKEKVIEILRTLDPTIEDLVTLSVSGVTQLYVRTKGKLAPLAYAGDGVFNLLSICLSVMQLKNGLVLIDELETGFHYSMYPKLWEILNKISKESSCQVIATTHSYELISAMSSIAEKEEDMAYFRLGNTKDQRKAFFYDGVLLNDALASELEVR